LKNQADIAVKDLLLVGGGHSHVGLLKMFAMNPLPGLRITLLTSDIHAPYSGMLPGFIAGQYSYDEVHLDLRPLAEFAGCRLYHSRVTAIDTEQQLVISNNRPPIHYDVLSINTGSFPDDYTIPGVRELAIPVKPIYRLISELNTVIHRALTDDNFNRIAVVGGGASGVELIMAIQHRLEIEKQRHNKKDKQIDFQIITATETILPAHNPSVQKRVRRIFKERNIQVHLYSFISNISLDKSTDTRIIHCDNQQLIHADAVFWCTTANTSDWPAASGLATDSKGFIQVNDFLQSVSHENIFAAGDVASMVNYERPKSGVFAVRQTKPLFNNIRRFVQGRPLIAYKPQARFLSLLNCANNTAIMSRGSLSFQGQWVWKYKNWIDTRFMEKFNVLPEVKMELDPGIDQHMVNTADLQRLREVPMRCGGCGAKVGSTILSQVIHQLAQHPGYRSAIDQDVVVGLEQGDDAAIIDVPDGNLLVQSVDYFKAFINDPYLLGRIATNHALGDIYAMGARPHSALALITLPFALEEVMVQDMYQVMSGAMDVIHDNEMTLLGGHSGEGADLSFGLSVNGFVRPDEIMKKSSLAINDVLILTKPLGTGTLLAANMRLKAKGRWIDEALENMLQSNRRAAEIFKSYSVKACTDITGFGLLGHLVEMLQSSSVAARLSLSTLPVLTGAHDVLKQGIVSSLHEENFRLKRAISNIEALSEHQNYPLLFDPQTAGGLLAGVSRQQAEECLAHLKLSGYHDAVIIGEVIDRDFSEHYVKLAG
jgi:selenide,water dikinase